MANPIIYSKIESLNRCLNRIKEKTPAARTALANDIDTQDIIVQARSSHKSRQL